MNAARIYDVCSSECSPMCDLLMTNSGLTDASNSVGSARRASYFHADYTGSIRAKLLATIRFCDTRCRRQARIPADTAPCASRFSSCSSVVGYAAEMVSSSDFKVLHTSASLLSHTLSLPAVATVCGVIKQGQEMRTHSVDIRLTRMHTLIQA